MTSNLGGLERRIHSLERLTVDDRHEEYLKVEAMENVLDAADSDEAKAFEDAINELIVLQECGHTEQEIECMMQERWPIVLDLMSRSEAEIAHLRSQRRRRVDD